MGHVAHITVKDVGYPTYKDVCLHYADNETLWYAMWQEWDEQYGQTHYDWPACPDEDDPNHLTVPDAWEFRYDSGRERYLARQWDTQGSNYPPNWTELDATWTDYLGDEPWGDYGVTLDANDTPEVTEQTRFLGGLGIQTQETVAQPPSAVLFHGDLIGSTMLLTDGEGAVAGSPTSYTAFGEQVWRDPNSAAHVGGPLPAGYPRHAYAGAWGYESGPWGQDPNEAASPGPLVLYGANPDLPPITLMHVGERWYQPGIGRFIQRDPIGLRGGLNLYAYCANRPAARVDPFGLAGASDPAFDWEILGGTTLAGVNIGLGWGGVGAIPGGIIGATTYVSYWATWTICVRSWDIGANLRRLSEQEEKNRKYRETRPDVFPPIPPNPTDGPVPCGPHY